MLVSALTKSVQ